MATRKVEKPAIAPPDTHVPLDDIDTVAAMYHPALTFITIGIFSGSFFFIGLLMGKAL